MANAAKVQTALKLSEEDQSTIQALKKEIEKAWKMVDASHEKVWLSSRPTLPCIHWQKHGNRQVLPETQQEARAKETIQQLKLEIANLTRLVEQGAGLGLGEESTVNELLKQKEELTRERDMQVDQIVTLRTELMELHEKLRLAETDKLALEGEIQVGGPIGGWQPRPGLCLWGGRTVACSS